MKNVCKSIGVAKVRDGGKGMFPGVCAPCWCALADCWLRCSVWKVFDEFYWVKHLVTVTFDGESRLHLRMSRVYEK